MPEPNKPGLAFLDDAIAVAGQVNAFIPLAVFAVKQLWGLMKKDNPSLTPEQFYDYLRAQGTEVKGISETWLHAHGYVQNPTTGAWTAPS